MRFSDLKGVLLLLSAAVAALWLAIFGKLNLYIHPRYIVFTVVFALLTIVLVVFGAKYGGNDELESKRWSVGRVAVLMICGFGVVALIVSTPSSLTSAIATQRGINAAAVAGLPDLPRSSPLFGNADYSNLSVKDWSGLLASTDDPEFFIGKNIDVTGFIVADQKDPKHVFYVSRFIVTCCVVDARPVGVPVYLPDWKNRFSEDAWVRLTGVFQSNESRMNQEMVVVSVKTLEAVDQPRQAYEF